MYYTDRLGSFNIICCNAKIAERGTRKGTKLNQTVLYYSALRHCLKVGLLLPKKIVLFWSCRKNGLIRTRMLRRISTS